VGFALHRHVGKNGWYGKKGKRKDVTGSLKKKKKMGRAQKSTRALCDRKEVPDPLGGEGTSWFEKGIPGRLAETATRVERKNEGGSHWGERGEKNAMGLRPDRASRGFTLERKVRRMIRKKERTWLTVEENTFRMRQTRPFIRHNP